MTRPQPRSTLFPYTTLFRSSKRDAEIRARLAAGDEDSVVTFLLFGVSFTSQPRRSEEHTSELQSRGHLVCRLLLEKKKKETREKSPPNGNGNTATVNPLNAP